MSLELRFTFDTTGDKDIEFVSREISGTALYAWFENHGHSIYGVYALRLTEADLEQLRVGKRLLWGQGEYGLILEVEGNE